MGMLELIETAIGITLVYLLLSLLATPIAELLLARLNLRALILRRAIREMLTDPKSRDEAAGRQLLEKLYTTPAISALSLVTLAILPVVWSLPETNGIELRAEEADSA